MSECPSFRWKPSFFRVPCSPPETIGALPIARRSPRSFVKKQDTGKRLRVNDQIRTSPVRLISDENEQLGLIDLEEAKRLARDAGLDLVEVSPNSEPPVCRVMDYGKWKYAQKKKEQKNKSNAKTSELKGMRLRPKIDSHDLGIKVSKAREFLEDGDKVQFTMLFRGREMAHKELGVRTMKEVAEDLADVSKVEQDPRFQGRRATMLLAPDRNAVGKAKDDQPEDDFEVAKPAPRKAVFEPRPDSVDSKGAAKPKPAATETPAAPDAAVEAKPAAPDAAVEAKPAEAEATT